MSMTQHWTFPLPRTHTGMLLGNGTLGAMVWGAGRTLRITLGRADLWDHRGGMPWTTAQSYKNIARCLRRSDEAGLRRLFEQTAQQPGEPRRPSVIPVGRIEIDLVPGAVLESGEIDLARGLATITVRTGRRTQRLRLVMDPARPVLAVEIPPELVAGPVRHLPAWKTLKGALERIGFTRPRRFSQDVLAGWVQDLPVDPGVCVAVGEHARTLLVSVERVPSGDPDPLARTARLQARAGTFAAIQRRAQTWWQRFWRRAPRLALPHARLQGLYEYGMYKFATFTDRQGVPATLQGPWIEEYQMPPWSSDYHFNINVQMCYQPAYRGNCLEHLLPLFDLIDSWKETLRHNAKVFLGIDDGYMLPHAVDDRCTCMGGFWTGSIDHGCTAWVALMMYDYFRHTQDRAFLRERAYPFMVGAMRVYEEMLLARGRRLALPISVSPEYRGAAMNAWGANASFQLACLHALNEALLVSARVLRKPAKRIWRRIRTDLPAACLIGPAGREQIALWEGTELQESHRHHSHLAGITPFDTLDLEDSTWAGIVERSIGHWIFRGPGLWSGWCVPWAAGIHTRLGNGEMAVLLLEIWERIFTNQGAGTLHDADVPGFTLMGISATKRQRRTRPEIMQMDAGMGVTAAILDLLLYERQGVHHLFRGAPREWQDARFHGLRTPGAFLVSAERRAGAVAWVEIRSLAGQRFSLANPWDGPVRVRSRGGRARTVRGRILRLRTRAGEVLRLTAARP